MVIKMTLLDKHIELLEAVNNAKTNKQYDLAYHKLIGFRDALTAMNINQLIACDLHYLDQGIDRPMCCGVFLDWEPEQILQ
jgi:hypothetical protein